MGKISTETWIAWLGATLVAAMTLTAFAYDQFPLKADTERRLDRIEDKLDRLLECTK